MTGFGNCYRCGTQTGRYDEDRHDFDCGCGVAPAPSQDDGIPNNFKKLIRTGRWEWIEKGDNNGNVIKLGVMRKSTGEMRFFA